MLFLPFIIIIIRDVPSEILDGVCSQGYLAVGEEAIIVVIQNGSGSFAGQVLIRRRKGRTERGAVDRDECINRKAEKS